MFDPKLQYEFYSTDHQLYGKKDFSHLLQKHGREEYKERYFKCLITPQKYEMANNVTHRSLATIANMTIRWSDLVDDINEAIKEVRIVPDSSDDSADEGD